MHFNVSQLMREPSGSTRSYKVEELIAGFDDGDAHPIRDDVEILRTDKSLWLSAVLKTGSRCTCCRCLEQYTQTIQMTIEEEAVLLAGPMAATEVKGPEDAAEGLGIAQNHILDLTEAVRQYTELNIPMKPVCRGGGCRGMCGTCGVNLNEASCVCEEVVRDSKWGPLLDLVGADLNNTTGEN